MAPSSPQLNVCARCRRVFIPDIKTKPETDTRAVSDLRIRNKSVMESKYETRVRFDWVMQLTIDNSSCPEACRI